jgi:putative transposase
VPQRKRKRPPRGKGAIRAFCPTAPQVLWAMDFQFDQTSDGANLKLLNIIDEFTREALATDVERSINAERVTEILDRLVAVHGSSPKYLRFDNGPEFIAGVIAEWAKRQQAQCVFIDPGSPWQNAWIESFNGRIRDECLNTEQFDSLLEAKVVINDWRHDYNTRRPHSSLGNLAPADYAQQWRRRRNNLVNSHT